MDEADTAPVGIPIELEDTGLITVPVSDRTEPVATIAPVPQITDMWSTDSESTDFSIAFRRTVEPLDTEHLRSEVGWSPPPAKPAPPRRRAGVYRAITSV